jgi:hypothetical protein
VNDVRITVPVGWPLTASSTENLVNSLPFVDEAIVQFTVDTDAGAVHLTVRDTDSVEQVTRKVTALLEKHKPIRQGDMTKVVFDKSHVEIPCHDDVFAQLVERGDIFEHSPGIFSLSGGLLEMYRVLDRRLLDFASTQSARDVVLPITTSLQTLNQADFFKRTPQFAQFMCTLKEDADRILDFSSRIGGQDPDFHFHDYLHPPRHMCRSAICLSSYPQFEGRQLAEKDYAAWTVIGKAFRNEASNVASLERLYEFSMREIIYFGDRAFVSARLRECMDWFIQLMESFGIQGMIQTANDPFFAEKIQALQFYQLAEQSKFEIRWNNPWSGNPVSVGSLNNHGAHFSKAYNIRLADGQYATTGCVGFGYERLIFLVLSQFGLDSKAWPAAMREFWGH